MSADRTSPVAVSSGTVPTDGTSPVGGPPAPEPALAELVRADGAVSGPARAAEFRAFLEADGGVMHRDGGPRHLTASAIVVDRGGDHVALVWHRKGRFWVQPGGHVESGETSFEQAARREVAEEIGLEGLERVGHGPAMLHRHGLDAAFGRCAEHWDVQFLLRAQAPAAELPLRVSEESGEVRWFPWPLRGAGPARDTGALPPGTVPDLPATLDLLAPYLARRSG